MLLPTLGLYLVLLSYFLAARMYGVRSTFSTLTMLSYFTFGCVGAVLISLYLEALPMPFLRMEEGTLWHPVDPRTWLTGPPIEELAKAIPIAVLMAFAPAARRIGIADFALIGFATGMGFDFAENNLHLLVAQQSPWAALAADGHAILGFWTLGHYSVGHWGYTIYGSGHWLAPALVGLGLGVGQRLWPNDWRRWSPGLVMLAWVTFEHCMWNFKGQHEYPNSFAPAAKPFEILYSLLLHGRLSMLALPILLILATLLEARLIERAVPDPEALRLPGETPGLRGELAMVWAAQRNGPSAILKILAYFRHRRAYALAVSDAVRFPGRAEADAFAATARKRLEAERAAIADMPPPRSWLPTGPQLRAALVTVAKSYWSTLAITLITVAVFGVAPQYVPWLHHSQAVVFAALTSAAFVAWRISVFARTRAPAVATTDAETLAARRTRYVLLASSVASSGLPLLAMVLHKPTLLPANHLAHALTALADWANGGGSTSTLLSTAGAMAAAVATGGDPQDEGEPVGQPTTVGGDGIAPIGADTPVANIPAMGQGGGSLAGLPDNVIAEAGALGALPLPIGLGSDTDDGPLDGGSAWGVPQPPPPILASLPDPADLLMSPDPTATGASDGDDDIYASDEDEDGEVLHAPIRTAGAAGAPAGKGAPAPQDSKDQTLGAGGDGGDAGGAGAGGKGGGGKGSDTAPVPAPPPTPPTDPQLQAILERKAAAKAAGDTVGEQAADGELKAYPAATAEHWATPQPDQQPASSPQNSSETPHTVERDGTGAPRTPEAPAPQDPSTTPEAIEVAKHYQRAQDEFDAAQTAADAFVAANPHAPLDPDLAYRLGRARLNLAATERPPSIWEKGRAPLSSDDMAARDTLGDVAKERTQIDNLPPDQREIASRGVVMAGQGDQTPADPALVRTDPGKWETMLQDKIADLDKKIAVETDQHDLNTLKASRNDTLRRLALYKTNYDTEELNTDDNHAAFGVEAKGLEKIVDVGTSTSLGEAGKQLTPMEAPVRMSEGTQARIARAHVQDRIDSGAAGERPAAGAAPASGEGPPNKPELEKTRLEPPPNNPEFEKTRIESPSRPPVIRNHPPGADPFTEPTPKAAGDGAFVNTPGAAGESGPGWVRDEYGAVVFTDVKALTPAQQATAYEVRNLNIDKQFGAGVSPAYTGGYSKPLSELRADDIAALKGKGPEFWQSIRDPKQKLYLEQLRDSPNPGLQIDKSMGPTFHPPGQDINREGLAPLVRRGGPAVDPKAPTVDVPPKGKQ